jgi:hypothetical protein
VQQKLAGSKYVSAAGDDELSAAHRSRSQQGKKEVFEFVGMQWRRWGREGEREEEDGR